MPTPRRSTVVAAVALLAVLPLASCQPRADAPLARDPAPPSLDQLRNASYSGLAEAEACTLSDGRWQGPPAAEGGASRPSVTFVRDFRLQGDLDADGHEEAMVLLAGNGGGTGENLYLAVVGQALGAPRQLALGRIGDRVRVRDARIEEGAIALDMLQHGAGDPMCCPGELDTRRWRFTGAALEEIASDEPPTRLTLDALGGSEWILSGWGFDEPAPAEPVVTLEYRDGRLAGNSGCNRYGADVRPGEGPGQFTPGPMIGTKMMCPPPVMEVEDRFTRLLAGARQFTFIATELAIACDAANGETATLFFRRAKPATAAADRSPGSDG